MGIGAGFRQADAGCRLEDAGNKFEDCRRNGCCRGRSDRVAGKRVRSMVLRGVSPALMTSPVKNVGELGYEKQ